MAKKPNKETQKKYKEMVEFGCVVCKKLYGIYTYTPPCIHHFTGAGMGLKDTKNFIPLCYRHHQGKEGIHHLGRFTWEDKFGKQKELLDWYEENKDVRD